MATTKVSELSALTTTDGAEELLINDGGTSKKVTIANLLADDQVTYAKIQNVSADERILGRVSGADGVIEELTKAQTLTMLNVEDGADVTDATNVTAAGALMDSELAGLAAVKATTGTFLTADQTKLDGIEASATADQSAAEIKTLLEDGIDSVHYVDGSIDLVHMSSESVDEDNLHISNAGTNGEYLQKQSGNAGGMTWAEVDALPSQTGHAGKYLTTNATTASWGTLDTDANTTTKGLYEMAHTISSTYSITSGNNAIAVAPVTINSGVSVTVPTGSTWTIV